MGASSDRAIEIMMEKDNAAKEEVIDAPSFGAN